MKVVYTEEQIKSIIALLDSIEVKGIKNISYLANVVQLLDKGEKLEEDKK